MNIFITTVLLFFSVTNSAALLSYDKSLPPPTARIIPYKMQEHGSTRTDDYFWLKERNKPEVLNYLKAENKYLNTTFKPVQNFKKQLFEEMKGRLAESETSYPVKDGSFYYFKRFEKNKQYPIYLRKPSLDDTAKEEVIIDVNKLAKGHSYYKAWYEISPDGNMAALIFDTAGRRFYNIKFKDLKTGKFLNNSIKKITEDVVWANDNQTIFYTKQDPETLRHDRVFRYNLKTNKSELIYQEKDETFEIYLSQSLAKKHVFINMMSTLSTEVGTISLDKPTEPMRLIFPREKNVEISVSEDENSFYFLTNKNSKNFKLMKTSFESPSMDKAEEVVAHRSDTYLGDFIVLKDYLALSTRSDGLTQIEILNKKNKNVKKVSFADSSYLVELGDNQEYDSTSLRYNYESMRLPPSVYDYDFAIGKSALRKTKEVLNYNPDNYVSERIFITARDGAKVPVSLLLKKDYKLDAKAPLFMDGYGAYGSNNEPIFNSDIFSLVDRGFIFAIAHIRGGGEMGRTWTDQGRTLHKKNTFHDFIDATEFLIQKRYVNSAEIYATGVSAGGLLIGYLANNRPELYKGLIADVPFVDALTTMLDSSIPLTTAEYDEWGNPNEKVYYDYIKTYSPYDNVKEQMYPNILVTTALLDSQVQYWEPAKWVAKMRKKNTGNNLILLHTYLDSGGHSGKSGRFEYLEEVAMKYAFILGLQ